jgi:hypothetical protein
LIAKIGPSGALETELLICLHVLLEGWQRFVRKKRARLQEESHCLRIGLNLMIATIKYTARYSRSKD